MYAPGADVRMCAQKGNCRNMADKDQEWHDQSVIPMSVAQLALRLAASMASVWYTFSIPLLPFCSQLDCVVFGKPAPLRNVRQDLLALAGLTLSF